MALELLEQRVAGLRAMKRVLAAGGGLARLALHPLPDLRLVCAASVKTIRCSCADLATWCSILRRWRSQAGLAIGVGQSIGDHAALLGDALRAYVLAVERDVSAWRVCRSQPSSSMKSAAQIELLASSSRARATSRVIRPQSPRSRPGASPSEQMICGSCDCFLFVDEAQPVVVAQRHDQLGELLVRDARAQLAVERVGGRLAEREAVDLLDRLRQLAASRTACP